MIGSMNIDVFADTYTDARQQFLESAQRAGAELLGSEPCPDPGPEGEALFTDLAWLGPGDAGRLLVLQSGTHGVEGYAGSAVQCHWLQTMPSLPTDTAVVFIHALNPWGMAWHRRCDQDGIDLNRNFVDFSQPLPVNEGYSALRDVLFSTDADSRHDRFYRYSIEHGREALEVALSGGQYQDAFGPFYGGQQPAHANLMLQAWMARYELARRQLAVIDLHTGLGSFGYGEIICDHAPDSDGVTTAHRWYGDDVALPLEGTSSSGPKHGLIDFAWHRIMGANSCFVTLEFGTYTTDELFDVLLEEHRQWASGRRSEECISAMRHHFCPDNRGWRAQVLQRSELVIQQALSGLAAS